MLSQAHEFLVEILMKIEKRDLVELADSIQQDVFDGINGLDRIKNIMEHVLVMTNEHVTQNECALIEIEDAVDRAVKNRQLDVAGQLKLAGDLVNYTDKELVDAIKVFETLVEEVEAANEALHRIEEAIVDEAIKNS